MKDEELLNLMASMINSMKMDLEELLKAQEVSNLLALANNPMVPEENRQDALNTALSKMGKQPMQFLKTEADNIFEEISRY